jgi:diguanylate cyclase (GGDEF)-like protein
MRAFAGLHRYLDRFTRAGILALAGCGVGIVAYVDYVTGYEVSMSVFYLGPVAVAAWYAGRWPGVAIGAICCVSWYITDFATGHQYSHPAIMVWDSLVRFGFFLVTGLLLTALRASYLRQRGLAQTDGLTELYSRRAFEDRLEHDLALAQRRKSAITLAYLDLDNFKALNDAHGHTEGDRVLQATGRVLKDLVRHADTAARLGGDEFALILPDTDGHGAQQAIANIALELKKAFTAGKFDVTCSIGVVTFLDPLLSVANAVAAADEGMYEAKRKSKGGIAFIVLGGAVQPRAASGNHLNAIVMRLDGA